MNRSLKTRNMTLMAVIIAIMVIMTAIPFLGYIPLGFMNATIIHIPVIIGAILLGPKDGAFLGFVFGCTSMWKNTFMANPTSFVFSPVVTVGGYSGNFGSIIVCMVPRILIGIAAYYVYRLIMKLGHESRLKKNMALFFAGVAGSMVNTILVMNFIYLFFGPAYAKASNVPFEHVYTVILGIICVNGVGEAWAAGILTTAVAGALMRSKIMISCD